MKRGYAVAAIAVAVLVAVWIRRIYCHDPEAKPSYTVQLGGCLPGAREITDAEYRSGIAAEEAATADN